MGFNLKKAVKTVATGGLSDVYDAVTGALRPGSQTVNQVPLETPEQRAARMKLSQFSQTGQYDLGNGKGFNVGEAYGGSLGNFDMTPEEIAANSKLGGFVSSSNPAIFDKGQAALSDLLDPNSRFDPYSSTGEYAPFQAAALKASQEAMGRAKAGAAFSGSLYSKSTGKNLSNIQTDTANTLQSKLAELFQNYTNQKIGAIPQALNYATTGQNLDLSKIQAGFQYGGESRDLANQGAQARLSEWLRQRQEMTLPLQTAQNLANKDPNMGVPSITTEQPSPWMDLLNLGAKGAGAYFGAKG